MNEYINQFRTAVDLWNGYKSGVIREDTISILQDLTIEDCYEPGSSVCATTYQFLAKIKFNTALHITNIKFLIKGRKSMENKKRYFLIIGILFIIIAIFSLIAILNTGKNVKIAENYNEKFANLPRHNMEYSYALDISTPEIAVDFYPYVFIAKVNKVVRTEYRNPTEIELTADGSETKIIYEPYTIYDITVIENLKGEIIENSNITIEQVGGVSKDYDYTIFPTDMEFLKENYYYILLPYATANTGELRLESSYNVIELGTLSDEATMKKILEISKIQELETVEQLSKEKSDHEEINKILTYKQAVMAPIDTKYYEELAKKSGVKDYETFYFTKNMSKYDVNYKKSNDSKY